MTTNRDWLFSLPLEEQYAWMNAEHQDSTLDGDTAAQDGDSRDKLEADVRMIAEAYNMDAQRHGTERFEHELYYSIIHLLDRQAAITEEQTRCKWVTASADEIAAWRSKAEKLQAQVYELTAERDKLKGQVFTLKSECDDLENERDNLADDLLTANRQREQYRKKLSNVMDAVHEAYRAGS